VRQFHFALRERIGIDGEIVVVGGDLDLAACRWRVASRDDFRRGGQILV